MHVTALQNKQLCHLVIIRFFFNLRKELDKKHIGEKALHRDTRIAPHRASKDSGYTFFPFYPSLSYLDKQQGDKKSSGSD